MLFLFVFNRKFQYHVQKIPVNCRHLLSTCQMWAEITPRAASTASSSTSPGESKHLISLTFTILLFIKWATLLFQKHKFNNCNVKVILTVGEHLNHDLTVFEICVNKSKVFGKGNLMSVSRQTCCLFNIFGAWRCDAQQTPLMNTVGTLAPSSSY